ncbi:hypothetical protein [Micromonospora cremea]|uniref:Uncharacterized protein n=1 Tax=Micromonospora cremea TaxID=709881 RepID=A0A1N5YXY6_9ACTN|nr:hypothetical protein [Micromonospora cremea]SIN14374.1 hypothetical protein SAMN04489832_3404 [Micromonospora cremea]
MPNISYTVTDADTVVEDLVNPGRGMSAVEIVSGQGHNKPARYFLSTRLTHRMLVNNIRRTITDGERDRVIAQFAQRLANSGPFRDLKFVVAEPQRSPTDVLATAGLDTAYVSRLVVLDPAQYSLRNGMEQPTIAALTVAMGLGKGAQQLPVQWASSAVYAVVNTQRRGLARTLAVEYLAHQKALAAPEVQNDADLKAAGTKELASAKEQVEKALKRAYQHVVYLAQPDPEGERYLDQLTFDDEHSTALDGTIVWKALAERDKVFEQGQFGPRALLHNMRDTDYGRALSDIRAAFYSAPRLPLLYGGDRDLQQAIYDAVAAGLVDVVDGGGDPVVVTAPNQVNLNSAGLRLAKPQPKTCDACGEPLHEGPCETPTGGKTGTGTGGGPGSTGPGKGSKPSTNCATCGKPVHSGACDVVSPATEQQVAFSFSRSLLSNPGDADNFASLLKTLYMALDERKISYLQGTLQLVLDKDAAADVQQRLNQIGITGTFKNI